MHQSFDEYNPVIIYYNPEERAKEKQASRDKDAADLASGKITAEELRKKNTFLSAEGAKINWAAAKKGGLW